MFFIDYFFFSNWIKYYSYIYFMMVRIILYNNKDYNNKTLPPTHTHTHKKKSYFLKGIDWRKCDFSRRIDFFFKLWNEMSRGFRRGETWHSPGYTTFCWSPVRWLSRLPWWRIIKKYHTEVLWYNACFMTLSKQNNNKIHYPDLPARYENKRVPRVSKIIRTL